MRTYEEVRTDIDFLWDGGIGQNSPSLMACELLLDIRQLLLATEYQRESFHPVAVLTPEQMLEYNRRQAGKSDAGVENVEDLQAGDAVKEKHEQNC